MPVSASLLMCHAPIVIPKVGRDRADSCRATTDAMESIANHVLNQNPDQIVVISPHTPRLPNKFGVLNQRISGSLAAFGHPNIKVSLPYDESLNQEICEASSKYFELLPRIDIDHGALVPLWFFQQLGWEGRTTVIGLPAQAPFPGFRDASIALAKTLRKDPQNFVMVASGDLSHCVKEDSPVPFHPDGAKFDSAVCKTINEGKLKSLEYIDTDTQKNAAEDCIESLSVVAESSGDRPEGNKVISYEAPFGVGYCVAILNQNVA